MKRLLLAALLLLGGGCSATELSPWFGTNFLLDARLDYLYQYYSRFNTGCGTVKQAANDSFVHGSISTTILGDWFVEAEGTMAFTHRQRNALDNLRITGRHLILDDVVGDPLSLVIGLTLTQAFNHSVHDPSSFHHGKFEGELHFSAGKETSCGASWTDRKWALIALGQADQGSPWGRVQLHWEKNRCDTLKGFVFFKFLWGFGHRELCCFTRPNFEEEFEEGENFDCKGLKKFRGYGLIRHRSIDIGGGFKKRWGYYLDVGVQVAYRVLATNFPRSVIEGKITLQYPFSL